MVQMAHGRNTSRLNLEWRRKTIFQIKRNIELAVVTPSAHL